MKAAGWPLKYGQCCVFVMLSSSYVAGLWVVFTFFLFSFLTFFFFFTVTTYICLVIKKYIFVLWGWGLFCFVSQVDEVNCSLKLSGRWVELTPL